MDSSRTSQWVVLLLALSVTLTACSGKPLTESECKQIYEIVVDSTIADLGPQFDTPAHKARLTAYAAPGISMCSAGQLYRRTDYDCLVGADTHDKVRRCLDAHDSKVRK